jgi:hypothetical protein
VDGDAVAAELERRLQQYEQAQARAAAGGGDAIAAAGRVAAADAARSVTVHTKRKLPPSIMHRSESISDVR